jgi:hypothetical protein
MTILLLCPLMLSISNYGLIEGASTAQLANAGSKS